MISLRTLSGYGEILAGYGFSGWKYERDENALGGLVMKGQGLSRVKRVFRARHSPAKG